VDQQAVSSSSSGSNPGFIRASASARACQRVSDWIDGGPNVVVDVTLVKRRVEWLIQAAAMPVNTTTVVQRILAEVHTESGEYKGDNQQLPVVVRRALELSCQAVATAAEAVAIEGGVLGLRLLAIGEMEGNQNRAVAGLIAVLQSTVEEELAILRVALPRGAAGQPMPSFLTELSPVNFSFAGFLGELHAAHHDAPSTPAPWRPAAQAVEGYNSNGAFATNILIRAQHEADEVRRSAVLWLSRTPRDPGERDAFVAAAPARLDKVRDILAAVPDRSRTATLLSEAFLQVDAGKVSLAYENWSV
jgi:hypothetical protein